MRLCFQVWQKPITLWLAGTDSSIWDRPLRVWISPLIQLRFCELEFKDVSFQ